MAKPKSAFLGFFYNWGTVVSVVVLVAFFGVTAPAFLDPSNLVNILRSISIVTVIAVGVTVSLAAGGFDLSVGSVASTANAVVISLIVWFGWGTSLAVPVTLAVALLLGALNAFLIVKVSEANLRKSAAIIDELLPIVRTLREGWEQIPDELANVSAVPYCQSGHAFSLSS